MHLPTLLLATTLLTTTTAFKCLIRQAGECYYYRGSTQVTSRCAIECSYKFFYAKCSCPDHYPGHPSWRYTGRHDCISHEKYKHRNQCKHHPAPWRRGLPGFEEGFSFAEEGEEVGEMEEGEVGEMEEGEVGEGQGEEGEGEQVEVEGGERVSE